jgi:hypothetical protein
MTTEEWEFIAEAIDYAIESAITDSQSIRKNGDEDSEWRASLLEKACSNWEQVHEIVKKKLPRRFADAIR